MRLAPLLLLLAVGVAHGRPPPPDPDPHDLCDDCREPEETPAHRPPLEWSTWFRLGVGMKPAEAGPIARATMPPASAGQVTTWDAALGIDLTTGISSSGNVRIGPWLEVRGLTVVGGGEVMIQAVPKSIDMFFYEGQGVLVMRAGGNRERATGQLAYGYLAPWKLFGEHRGTTRYMIGVRFVASYTRAIEDPRDWSATIGIETEPFGALRYLFGIKSLY